MGLFFLIFKRLRAQKLTLPVLMIEKAVLIPVTTVLIQGGTKRLFDSL